MTKTTYENNVLTIKLGSEINTINANTVKEEIVQQLNKHDAAEVIFDAQDLNYISSAGLRIFWQFHQRIGKKFRICNVLPQVYDLFAVTHFSDIIDVKIAG